MCTRLRKRQEEARLGQDMLGCNAAPTAPHSHTLDEAKSLFANAVADSQATAGAVPVQLQHLRMGDIGEEPARFEVRDESWILASRKRKTQPACSSLNFSPFEGARLSDFGQAEEKSCTTPDENLEAGCSPDGEMDIPLTPEIVHNHWGRSPSVDHTSSSPEPSADQDVTPSPEKGAQQGELLRNEETCANPPSSEQPMPKTNNGANTNIQKEQVVTPEETPNAKEKTTTKRKRKYKPKIRAEKPSASRAKKPRNSKLSGRESIVTANATPPVAEIPEVMTSPSLLQMKSFARINQRYPKQRKRSPKPAIPKKSFPESPPACQQPEPQVVQDRAHSDDISRLLRQLSETTQVKDRRSSSNASLFTFLSNWVGMPRSNQEIGATQEDINGDLQTPSPTSLLKFADEIVDHSPVEDPPSSPPFLSTCRDFTLVMPPSSPSSPRGVTSDAADLWDSFELEATSRFPATSVRRTLNFDAPPPPPPQLDDELIEPWLHKCHMNQLNQVNVDISQPNPSRENELQMVTYDDGSKKMVVYTKPSRGRRIKYKPKVNLDSSTVRMFKTLTIKGTSAGDEAAAEQEKDTWEQTRHQWQHRAHHFISIMREVQGSRAFSRWKGSVVDSVGGAFLTQNVSDFLSSNAFISLRARFPARKTQSQETISTKAVEKEVDLKKHQMEDDQRQEERANSPPEEETLVEMLRTSGLNECQLDPQSSLWKRQLASTVIQEKFASVVTESVVCLTEVGREKVLAATLRQVLGKKHTTRETGGSPKALKSFKLRPARAALRRSSDNYRYRHNVSFRLLSGEARASWEAGFVMKCQKATWEPLRAAIMEDESYCRDPQTEDCVDWSAVQQASVHELADVIKNRGQHNALAGRMKAFLDRVHRDQNGSIDLEWIRKLRPEDAKAFLLSFRGVGLKSVECIRLLTLHHPSFPVDTNVGRILVRLGWVPLEPLPEETQLHLLELYPIQSQIQQYIWPRLCTLDQKTLYELHYQMITFGKVFCTKSKPNCNACPLRSECKHYASSYASAKLLLKWPEQDEKKQSRMLALEGRSTSTDPPPSQYSTLTQEPCIPIIEEPCIPIIEEPQSPEPTDLDSMNIPDIEELPFNVEWNKRGGPVETSIGNSRFSEIIEELLDVKKTLLDLNCEPEPDTFVLPPADTEMLLQPQVSELNTNEVPMVGNSTGVDFERSVEDGLKEPTSQRVADEPVNHLPSHELILLPPQASLAPAPKLKNVQRLRTVHFVYELPDNHPLLFEMDKREADDPCVYLLAIWSPDEVPATMPKINDDDASNPFASCQDNDTEKTVRGTLLIPCKTAMRGYFPLNGTYFQVNEVFADHASSVQPIDVPRTLLWSLRRRFVYFSTAVSNLFRDMSQEEIQCCFQKGYVCLRAFDVATRQPKILAPRLHQSGAKIVNAPTPRKGRGGRGRKTDKPQAKTKKKPTTSEAPLMETQLIQLRL